MGSSAKAGLETSVRPPRPAGTEAASCSDCQSAALGLGKAGHSTANSTPSVLRRLRSHGLWSMSFHVWRSLSPEGTLGSLQLGFSSSELEVSAHPEAREFVFLAKLLIIAVVTLVGLLLICELFTRSRKGKMC